MTWELVRHDLVGLSIITLLVVAALAGAEIARRVVGVRAELSRKVAHIGSGFGVLLIPIVIDSVWTVLALTGGFALLLFTTHRVGLLPGLHGVRRGIGGVLWYAGTTFLMYVLVFEVRDGSYLDYAIPVLVLVCADAVAATVGSRHGRRHYEVAPGHFRSIEGSIAFAVVAFTCVSVPLLVGSDSTLGSIVLVSLVAAVCATLAEAISIHGIDNLLVPLVTLVCVGGLLPDAAHPALDVALWVLPAAALIAATTLVARRATLCTLTLAATVPLTIAMLAAAVTDLEMRSVLHAAYLGSIACQLALLTFLALRGAAPELDAPTTGGSGAATAVVPRWTWTTRSRFLAASLGAACASALLQVAL